MLEEIVGNIYDDFDPVENDMEQLEDGVWRMRGSVGLDAISELFGIPLPEDEFDTLGGMVFACWAS
jgi:CBS domain containing-hemolysin-like protein